LYHNYFEQKFVPDLLSYEFQHGIGTLLIKSYWFQGHPKILSNKTKYQLLSPTSQLVRRIRNPNLCIKFVHMYVNIYIHIYIYKYIYTYIFKSIYTQICVSKYMYIYEYIYMYILYIYICIYYTNYLCICTYLYLYIW